VFTGTPEELRRKEGEAAVLARQIAELLTTVERLGIGIANGHISGPAFSIRRGGNGWTVSN
jgi:hypothetical protein